MSSILASNGMVLAATAMAAVSGTVILLAFRVQKSLPPDAQFTAVNEISGNSVPDSPRSCLSSDRKKQKKKKKRVHFAEDVVDPIGNGEAFRRQHIKRCETKNSSQEKSRGTTTEMPANRIALYAGILRDRAAHRPAYY